MDANPAVPEATGLERHCHCEQSVAISGIAELVPRKRGISLLAMTKRECH
jgi:hypothetical protein